MLDIQLVLLMLCMPMYKFLPPKCFFDQDGFYDFNWCDIQLSDSDIEALIKLAKKQEVKYEH